MKPNGITNSTPDLSWSLGLTLTAYLVFWLSANQADPDLWGYLAFGRLFWESRSFPYGDVYSYAPTLEPWVYHEWLSGALLFPVYEYLGGAGLQALKIALGLTTAWLALRMAREQGASLAACAITLFLAGGAWRLGYSPVRAQVFTFFFFTLTALVLERYRRDQRMSRLAWLIPVHALWANLHGGFVAGLGLMILYALGQAMARRPVLPLLLALVAATLATLVNPYGLGLWTYLAQALSMPRPDIGEWHSVWQAMAEGQPSRVWILGPLLGLLTLAFLLALRWRDACAWLVLGVTAGLGLMHLRHQVLFLLAFAMFFPAMLERCLAAMDGKEKEPRKRSLGRLRLARTAALGLFTAWLVMKTLELAPWRLEIPDALSPEDEFHYPLAAVEFIEKEGLGGRLLPLFQWGEYLLWRLHPACLVGMDGRYETVYPPDYCRAYFNFLRAGPGWRDFLEAHPPDMILLAPDIPAVELLRAEAGYQLAFANGGSVLFRRAAQVPAPSPAPSPPQGGEGGGEGGREKTPCREE